MADDRSHDWLFQRAVRRVACVDAVVADYATSICGRSARRRDKRFDTADGRLGTVTWFIDGEAVLEFTAVIHGRHPFAVYDIGLLRPIRELLRSRHLEIDHRAR